jgi:hypothetical protein
MHKPGDISFGGHPWIDPNESGRGSGHPWIDPNESGRGSGHPWIDPNESGRGSGHPWIDPIESGEGSGCSSGDSIESGRIVGRPLGDPNGSGGVSRRPPGDPKGSGGVPHRGSGIARNEARQRFAWPEPTLTVRARSDPRQRLLYFSETLSSVRAERRPPGAHKSAEAWPKDELNVLEELGPQGVIDPLAEPDLGRAPSTPRGRAGCRPRQDACHHAGSRGAAAAYGLPQGSARW